LLRERILALHTGHGHEILWIEHETSFTSKHSWGHIWMLLLLDVGANWLVLAWNHSWNLLVLVLASHEHLVKKFGSFSVVLNNVNMPANSWNSRRRLFKLSL